MSAADFFGFFNFCIALRKLGDKKGWLGRLCYLKFEWGAKDFWRKAKSGWEGAKEITPVHAPVRNCERVLEMNICF